MSCYRYSLGHKKSVKLAFASSTTRGLRIAQNNRTDNAKPTPNIKYTLVLYHSQGTRVRICIYANGVP